MSQKAIYITIGILAALGVLLFVAGLILVQQNKIPGIEPKTVFETFPFGEGSAAKNVVQKPPVDLSKPEETLPRDSSQSFGALRKISTRPIAGAVIFEKDKKTFTRYVEKQTGHVYEADGGTGGAQRISNTTVPGILHAFWDGSGESVALRYLTDGGVIKTVAARISVATTTNTGALTGTPLPDNIREVVVSPSQKKIFYILSLGNAAVGTVAESDGTKKKQVFDSSATEWNAEWINTNTITLLTKPSAFSNGFLYSLHSGTGAFKKIMGGISGLTARASKDVSKVLFSASANNSFETFVYSVKNNAVTPFPITTLPEKCLWSSDNITLYCGAPESIPAGAYPDIWYQGRVSFSDTVWKIDTETGALDILAIPADDAREEIDLINPMLDRNEKILIFTNKKSSSLWSLQLP